MELGQSSLEKLVMASTCNPEFWKGRRVLLTGHTGFKGSWLAQILLGFGSKVFGYALEPITTPNLFTQLGLSTHLRSITGNINDGDKFKATVREIQPEVVIHLAAQALVLPSYANPLDTFETNVLGTAKVLDACRGIDSLRGIVSVTTDKVYENKEHDAAYRETDHLGGHDPYSASKACTEIVTASYRLSFLRAKPDSPVGVATARAGNVIGGGDWSEYRLVPDIFRTYFSGQTLQIRNPHAVRPWQHVLESLVGYLTLAQKLTETPAHFSGAYNFGPRAEDSVPVKDVLDIFQRELGGKLKIRFEEAAPVHEAQLLKLDSGQAHQMLGWQPRWNLTEALHRTATWYVTNHDDPRTTAEMTVGQINDYFRRETHS